MAYYMSNGTKVSEGAAGLGAMPPQAAAGTGQFRMRAMRPPARRFRMRGSGTPGGRGILGTGAYFGRDDPQAAAGIGYPLFLNGRETRQPTTLYHGPGMEGLGQNAPGPQGQGCPPGLQLVYDVLDQTPRCVPEPGGGAHPGAADPAVHGGAYTGTATSRFGCMMEFQRTNNYAQYEECMKAIRLRDQVATEGSEPVPYGTATRAFREGILGGRGLAPDSFGVRTRPWRDGIFGGGLGQNANGNGTANGNGNGTANGNGAANGRILGMSPLTLTAVTVGGVVLLVGAFALRKK